MVQKVRKFRNSVMLVGKLLLAYVMLLLFVTVWREYYPQTFFYPEASFWQKGNLVMTSLYAAMLLLFTKLYKATDFGMLKFAEIIYSLFLSIFITDIFAFVQLSLMARDFLPPLPMLLLIIVQFAMAVMLSLFLERLYFALYPVEEVLMICADSMEDTEYIEKMNQKRKRYQVKKIIYEKADIEEIVSEIQKYRTIVIGNIDLKRRNEIISYCRLNRKMCYIRPFVTDVLLNHAQHIQIFDSPVYYCKNMGIALEQRILKRMIDIIVSVLMLLIASPIMIITALCIKLEDGGPVFYSQKRLTKSGKEFAILKFRSMIVNAEKRGAQMALQNDDRITKVGKIIRSIRIDELPQLLNVLVGDMAIVGPRPERPEIAAEYEKENPLFRIRLNVKAGLTGYAQVFGKYNSTFSDKLLLDTIYIEKYSLLLDFILMFLTVKILFIPESSEGFKEK